MFGEAMDKIDKNLIHGKKIIYLFYLPHQLIKIKINSLEILAAHF